jgi:hypothetical protein
VQACSTCGAGRYKQILDGGAIDGIQSIDPYCMCSWSGVSRGGSLGICCVCGELLRASALKGM